MVGTCETIEGGSTSRFLIVGDGMGDLDTHVMTHVDFVTRRVWAVLVIWNLLGGKKPAHNCCSGCDGYM